MNRLDRAYSMVPNANCKGLCQEACGPIVPSLAEEARVRARYGVVIDFDRKTLGCTLLHDGRCGIYADRPLLCRLFGAVEKMPCPFGCAPDSGSMKQGAEKKALELVYGKPLG